MQRHKLPQLLPTLKRLEAELEKLRTDGDAIEYAKRVLERSAIEMDQLRINAALLLDCRTAPNRPSACDAS